MRDLVCRCRHAKVSFAFWTRAIRCDHSFVIFYDGTCGCFPWVSWVRKSSSGTTPQQHSPDQVKDATAAAEGQDMCTSASTITTCHPKEDLCPLHPLNHPRRISFRSSTQTKRDLHNLQVAINPAQRNWRCKWNAEHLMAGTMRGQEPSR